MSLIKDYTINLPDLLTQKSIIAEIEYQKTEIDVQRSSLENEYARLNLLYHKILQEAFSGKLSRQIATDSLVHILLQQYTEIKTSYNQEKKIINKIPKSSRSHGTTLKDLIIKKFRKDTFTFEELKSLTESSIDDLKSELLILLENEKRLNMFFDKKSKSIKYQYNED